jgi:hypothetical protein
MTSEEHAPVGLDEENQNSSKSSKQDVDIEATLKLHKEEHKEGYCYFNFFQM